MRALVLVVVIQWALAMDMPIMTKSSYKSTTDHCTPGYFRIVLDSGELCVYCICWGDMETCGAMQYRRCLGDDVVIRRLRHKRNASALSYADVFTKNSVRKKNLIKLDEVNPEKQKEIYIKTSKAKAFNARKQTDSNSSRDVRDANGKNIIDNEIFGVFRRDGGKETGKILEEQQTLALIRNSKSRVIHTGNIMSVTSKPRFVRSHKKENGIKLNIKQKRTSYKKDLAKKFKKPSFYRTKRQVEADFVESKNSDLLSNTTEQEFQMEVFTNPQSTTEAISTFDASKTTVGGFEETTAFDTENPEKTSRTSNWSSNQTDVTNFYTTEQITDTVHPEITKHLYDVTENIGEVANADIPSHVNKFHVIAENIPEANDIKFKDWTKLDTVENNSNIFHWTKEEKELSAKESILLNKFKRIFRKKSNVIRTKPFTVGKSDRVYVTNVPSSSVANIKEKFPNAVFKNITNIQHLLKEILIRLKAAHANEKSKEEKIDNDFIWRLKDHESKIKKHSHLLTSYKNLGSCAINTRKKQIIDGKVNELHNHTKDIFELIEFLKNVPTTAITDRIVIKNNTVKFINSVGKFAYLLNEIINIATCKRNNKLQRIMRHISRRQSHNPKVNEAVSKMKLLIGRYSAVQNTFVNKMYEAIHNFDDNNTARVKSALIAANTSKVNNTAEMDAITMKITKNLKRLKELVQNLNKGRKVKRDVSFEKQIGPLKGLENLYTSQSRISVTIPFYKEVNELIAKIVGSLRQLKNYLQDMIPNDDASMRTTKNENFTRKGSESQVNNKYDTTPVEEIFKRIKNENNKVPKFKPIKLINMTLRNLNTPKIAEEITKNLTSLIKSFQREKRDATDGNDLKVLRMKTVHELHDIDIGGEIKDIVFDLKTKMHNDFDVLKKYFARSLKDLRKAFEERKDQSLRTKREVPDDDTMDMLLLVEYMLKQKLAVRRPPVEDGIDALIEAIRKAPDVRTVKNKILGINFTDFNVSKTSDENDERTNVNKYDEEDFDDSNHIRSQIDRNNREAYISDMSSDDDVPKDSNENKSREAVSAINKEMDEFDPGLEDYENIRPVEVDNNHVDIITPADITVNYVSDSVESSESNVNSKVKVNIVNSSDEHKKVLDSTEHIKDLNKNHIDHESR